LTLSHVLIVRHHPALHFVRLHSQLLIALRTESLEEMRRPTRFAVHEIFLFPENIRLAEFSSHDPCWKEELCYGNVLDIVENKAYALAFSILALQAAVQLCAFLCFWKWGKYRLSTKLYRTAIYFDYWQNRARVECEIRRKTLLLRIFLFNIKSMTQECVKCSSYHKRFEGKVLSKAHDFLLQVKQNLSENNYGNAAVCCDLRFPKVVFKM
jgi:hypothetical protein